MKMVVQVVVMLLVVENIGGGIGSTGAGSTGTGCINGSDRGGIIVINMMDLAGFSKNT